MRSAALFLFVLPILAGCAGVKPQSCSDAGRPSVMAELLFGRNIGDQVGVTDADWARFVDEEVTPRFPDGLTVIDSQGQWRDTRDGHVVREPSKVLRIVLFDDAEGRKSLAAVADAYKRRFDQQAVATILQPACTSF
jgi:hypothetical protein